MALSRRGKKMILIIKGIVTVVVILFILLFAIGSTLINYERTKFCKAELAKCPENKFINFQDKVSRILSRLN